MTDSIPPDASDPTPATSAAESPSPSAPSLHDQASRLSALIDESGVARRSVVTAVQAVQTCSAVADGASALTAAVTSRQDVLDQLDTLDVSALPDGAGLRSMLHTAIQESRDADRHFAAWAQSILNAGGCRRSAPQDS